MSFFASTIKCVLAFFLCLENMQEVFDTDFEDWDWDEDSWGNEGDYVTGLEYFQHPTLNNGYVSEQGWEVILDSVEERVTFSSYYFNKPD
ncbi:hypothetical protein ACFFHM_14110 [Halalkalibacter kiskunsagensis]|uniref:Uncharacterized protein n=1 Tax=Halalkalibacter kiskunsagensis TaxID=1548599 RepID=A0ABV6KE58_9BACI